MDIIMAFNTGFLLPALTTIYSLFINNSNIRLHILYKELSDNAKILIRRLEKAGSNNTVEYIPIDGELLERIKVATGRWRQECFFRYYVTELLPDADRVLWLDADILVRKSVEELYNIEFDGKSFAAVYDNTSDPERRLGISDYVNSGVLMINIKKLKETGKMNEFWELVASADYKGELPDQDALNIVFKDDIKQLDVKFNTFPLTSDNYADYLINNAVLVHFISKHKPWNMDDVEYFNACFTEFRTSEVFVTEYWEKCDKAVAFVE